MKKTFVLKEYKKTNFEKSITDVKINSSMLSLPLIHKVDCVDQEGKDSFTAFDYFHSGSIEPIECNVFGENLVYTYIGRPSYRELQIPACFVIKPGAELIQNVFIFDSGAYYDNRYSKVVDNELDVNLFRIPANEEMIKKFITLYFGNNTYYYFGLAKSKEQIDDMKSLEEFNFSMLKKIVEFNRVHFDTRCRTLENILRTAIPLEENLMAIILPKSLLKNNIFISFCEKCKNKFDIMFYEDENGSVEKKQCNRRTDQILLQYYLKKGYIEI